MTVKHDQGTMSSDKCIVGYSQRIVDLVWTSVNLNQRITAMKK